MSQDEKQSQSAESNRSERSIKVTDRRMFAPDGTLREEYRELENAPPPEARVEAREESRDRSGEGGAPAREAPRHGPGPERAERGRGVGGRLRDMLGGGREEPAHPSPPSQPEPEADEELLASFQDLVALLAQSASVYLQQAAQLQVSQRAEAVEMARLHVELLRVLQIKTEGNLDPREKALLDDALYQLRMAFVEHG